MNEIISFSISDWLSSYYKMLILHCSITAESLLAPPWFLSLRLAGSWLRADWESQQLFPFVWRKYFVREDREGGQWVGTAELCQTLLPLHSPPAKINSGNRKVPHQQISLISPGLPPHPTTTHTATQSISPYHWLGWMLGKIINNNLQGES